MRSDGSAADTGHRDRNGHTKSARKAFFSYFIKNALQMVKPHITNTNLDASHTKVLMHKTAYTSFTQRLRYSGLFRTDPCGTPATYPILSTYTE
jgi:hypothetical protein